MEDAQFTDYSLNGMVDSDREYLYYLADTDDGEGTLMRLKLNDPGAKPEKFSEDVCSADISRDGSRLMLIKNVKDGSGDLYLWTAAGEEKLDSSVDTIKYSFSYGGNALWYVKNDGSGDTEEQTLYMKAGKWRNC